MEKRELIEGTCPECRGPLTEVQDGALVEFHCLVGHRYSPEALLRAHYDAEERTLWSAVVGLEEATKLVQAVAPHVAAELVPGLESVAREKHEQAGLVRDILDRLKAYPLP